MYSLDEKKNMASRIRLISKDNALQDFLKLKNVDLSSVNMRSRVGNKCVDYFTLVERLSTKSHQNLSFFDIYFDRENLIKKKYIADLIEFEIKRNYLTEIKRWKVVQQVYFKPVNIFKPLNAMQIYKKFKPVAVLDACSGWGCRLVGAAALNVPFYYGIDLNTNLEQPYHDMVELIQPHTSTTFSLFFEDALLFDYSKVKYDLFFTSPPYFNLEIYSCNLKREKKDWIIWYRNFVELTYKNLDVGGNYCLNVPIEIYEKICIDVLGIADEIIPFNKCLRRQDGSDKYKEFIYCWCKKDHSK